VDITAMFAGYARFRTFFFLIIAEKLYNSTGHYYAICIYVFFLVALKKRIPKCETILIYSVKICFLKNTSLNAL
jgi:hypothetical protein